MPLVCAIADLGSQDYDVILPTDVVAELRNLPVINQSINQSIWRIFIAPLKIKFHRGASTRRHNHTGTILNDI